VMAGLVVRESVTLAGRAERARAARSFVSEVLGPRHPCGDAAVLLVSEVFSNSVRHSDSGAPGETITVAVRAGDGIVRFEVTDRAGPGDAGVAACRPRCGRRPRASACCGACVAVWLATARRADGHLVRAAA
jgi:anti-sigma regulatory factor (Ser/Thr protein kinase)